MSVLSWFEEQIYVLFSMYYYEVFLYKNNIQIGRLIQSLSYSQKFIVDFKRKLAFVIVNDRAFIKGHKMILHYNIDNGIPLKVHQEIKIDEINDNVVKTKKVKKFTADIPQSKIKKSENLQITEENLPPSLILEIFNAHFTVKVLAKPKTTDWTIILILACVVVALIALLATGVLVIRG